jgi:hypothetical protein
VFNPEVLAFWRAAPARAGRPWVSRRLTRICFPRKLPAVEHHASNTNTRDQENGH